MSSSGGSYKQPNQPTPGGPTSAYGESTPFNPGFINVLPAGGGWATPESVEAQLASGQQQQAANQAQYGAQQAAARAAGAGPTGLDAFAQQLIDWDRSQRMTMMGGRTPDYSSRPKATTPTQQLMLAGLADRQRSQMSAALARKHQMTLGSAQGGRSGGHSQR